MRRAAKIDDNQHEVVDAFRKMGFSILMLHQVGNGCPDLLIARRSRQYLIEIKDGSKPLSEQKLTPKQKKFHDTWRGEIFIVHSVEEAFTLALNLEERG